MKKIRKIIATILVVSILSSCSEGERKYNQKVWQHKARMLDIEYINSIVESKQEIEFQQCLMRLDSLHRSIQNQ